MADTSLTIRPATAGDVDTLVGIINRAFAVERFFVDRDRTDADTVRGLLAKGTILVGEIAPGVPAACVYVERRGDRGYFGLLSVDPLRQGHGLGRRMIDEVESHFRGLGCRAVDIRVVNLREELPPIYRRLGYVEQGVEPFEDPSRLRPAHFILMSKAL